MSKTVAIIGSGHLGVQLAHFAISGKFYDSVVFFDDFTADTDRNGHEILGKTDVLLEKYGSGAFDELLIGIGYNHLEARKAFFEKFSNDVPFGQIIHHTSWVDPSAKINPGSVIYPNCCIDANTVICENVLINLSCTIAHDCRIEAHSFLAPRVAVAGFVNIGEQCFLGINTTVKDNISIISGTISGAAALFVKDVSQSGLYVGQPAKKIR